MHIKSLTLENAFQHKKLKIEFSNFNAIIGKNGCGKSNLIESLRYIFTGKLSLPGTQDTMITEGEEKGKISAEFEVDGEVVSTSTSLGSTRRSLTRGDLKLTKGAEVLSYLSEAVLKTPVSLIDNSIIRQGRLTDGLFDPPAKRIDMFMRMAGLSDIEKKRQQLADINSAIIVPMAALTLEEAEKEVVDLTARLKETQDSLAAIVIPSEADVAAARETLAKIAGATEAGKELEEYSKTKAEVTLHTLSTCEAAVASAKDKLATANAEEIRLEPLAKEAAIVESAIAEHMRVEGIRKQATDGKQELLEMIEDLKSTKPTDDYIGGDIDELLGMIATIKAQIGSADKTLTFLSLDAAICPVCNKPCTKDEAAALLTAADSMKKELVTMLASTQTSLATETGNKEQWKKAVVEYASLTTTMQEKLVAFDATIAALPGQRVVDTGNGTAAETIVAYTVVRSELAAALKDVDTTASELAIASKAASDLLSHIAVLEEKAALLDVTVDTAALDVLLAEHTELTELKARTEGIKTELEHSIETADARLVKVKSDVEESKTSGILKEYIDAARTVLHRDHFPSGKITAFVNRMMDAANSYLDCMNAGFFVTYDKDLGFSAEFLADGKVMRADRLSGGEKVIFALAFRFAGNELNTDTGFLVLDEPTVFLDEQHVADVVTALALVKEKLAGKVQVLVVTHDERLASVADSVYTVGQDA